MHVASLRKEWKVPGKVQVAMSVISMISQKTAGPMHYQIATKIAFEGTTFKSDVLLILLHILKEFRCIKGPFCDPNTLFL